MSQFRPWAFMRRVQYAFGFALFWSLIGVGVYFMWFYTPSSCFDLTQNGNETGVDCGGGCTRICAFEVIPPSLIWADSFEITPGQYNSVAYVENKNQYAATPELHYKLELVGKSGNVIATRSGSTILPPNSIYPIFEGRVFTEVDEPVTETRLTMEPANLWLPASIGRGQFKVTDIDLQSVDVRPRLDARIENTELVGAEDIEVVATIFDDQGTPLQASQTFVSSIPARSERDITFTWPQSIAKTVRSCTVPTDVVLAIDTSGSMNNDGGEPPQPISAALAAASTFAKQLRDSDQIGVVTFATAVATQPLSANHTSVANDITQITINPSDETGFTDTAGALRAAQAELESLHHNENARRVLVLLTDGLPTAPGDTDAVTPAMAIADELDAAGVEIYAIGLGQNVDRAFITEVASGERNAYFAPSHTDLANIYNTITGAICESGPTKVDVIAKTTTNFAPLR